MTKNITIYKIEGPFDAQSVLQLEKDFDGLVEVDKNNVVMDLSHVDFMDSSGIGKIVFLYKRLLVQERSLKLIGLNGQPEKIIKTLRIDKTIESVSLEEAA